MTKRERVLRAITFNDPDRIPVWHFNYHETAGDILRCELALEHGGLSEWGYRWVTMDDGTMGQPSGPVIPSWDDLTAYEFPERRADDRLAGLPEFMGTSDAHYLLAGMGITGFTTYTFLRGFEHALVDFVLDADRAGALLDRIFAFENDMAALAADQGFQGIHYQDDWGTQESLIISPDLWRTIFKPRYREQFERVHRLGMHVWFHSCGNILAILPDLYEIGVDVMNISQPNVMDISTAGSMLRGRQCFMAPISYQTVSLTGTREEIFAEAERLHHHLGTERGGFIGYVEEYSALGMSRDRYQACIDAFNRR